MERDFTNTPQMYAGNAQWWFLSTEERKEGDIIVPNFIILSIANERKLKQR